MMSWLVHDVMVIYSACCRDYIREREGRREGGKEGERGKEGGGREGRREGGYN